MIRSLLSEPLTRGLDLDDPKTTVLRREIVKKKPFLNRIYEEWYATLAEELLKSQRPDSGAIVEIGSGPGFLEESVPDIVKTEIFHLTNVDAVVDATAMPFSSNSLSAIVMTDVFHHIPKVEDFLVEADRCIEPGGRLVMIEPWKTGWSELIYNNLHHEPFEPDSGWELDASRPLSDANGALPWIVFRRDAARFEGLLPNWKLEKIQPFMPLAYLLSGGLSMRSLMPGFMYDPIRKVEEALNQDRWAMFAFIVVRKLDH